MKVLMSQPLSLIWPLWGCKQARYLQLKISLSWNSPQLVPTPRPSQPWCRCILETWVWGRNGGPVGVCCWAPLIPAWQMSPLVTSLTVCQDCSQCRTNPWIRDYLVCGSSHLICLVDIGHSRESSLQCVCLNDVT